MKLTDQKLSEINNRLEQLELILIEINNKLQKIVEK